MHSAGVLRLKPPAEVLNPHPMLDRGLLDPYLQLRQPLADLLYPNVSAQDSQRLRHRLVQLFRGDLDDILGAAQIAAGDQAGKEGHAETMIRLVFATEYRTRMRAADDRPVSLSSLPARLPFIFEPQEPHGRVGAAGTAASTCGKGSIIGAEKPFGIWPTFFVTMFEGLQAPDFHNAKQQLRSTGCLGKVDKKGQELHTQAKLSLLHVGEVTDEFIEVLPTNAKGKHPYLRYDKLDALWKQRDFVKEEISKPQGKGINKMAGQIWSESNLRPDTANESYYWAVVSERMKGEEGLLGLDSDYEAAEGKPHLVQHLRRERDRTLARKKKQAVLKLMGRLACEACGFDFAVRYLDLGRNFCEVHHRTLLAKGPTINNLDDLAILCSNCHRTIHLTEPMESVDTFRKRFSQAAVI
jgi:hypothetical protein